MSNAEEPVIINGNPALAARNSDEMDQALEFLTRPVRQTMRLDIFERDFLPFFDLRGIPKEIVDQMLHDMMRRTGLKQTERDLVGNMIGRWLSVVRSAYLETEILNGEGETVFTVPPILRSPDDVVAVGGEYLMQLVETATNQANVHPTMGDNFFKTRILPQVIQHPVSIEELKQWNIIFDKYKMPRYVIPGEEVATNEQGAIIADANGVDPDSTCDYELD